MERLRANAAGTIPRVRVFNTKSERRTEANEYGTFLLTVILINPKLVGALTIDDLQAAFKRNLGLDTKYLYISLRGLDGFVQQVKKYGSCGMRLGLRRRSWNAFWSFIRDSGQRSKRRWPSAKRRPDTPISP